MFRKTLPELAAEYVALRDKYPSSGPEPEELIYKADEIREQLRVMAVPPQTYHDYLPLFPDIYRLAVSFPGSDWPPLVWESPVPRPQQQNQTKVDVLEYSVAQAGGRAKIHCQYRIHAFNQLQHDAAARQQQQLLAVGIGFVAILPVVGLGYWSLQRERRRERQRLLAQGQAEHAGRIALQEKVARQDAERTALEMKSQLSASIGIMAGPMPTTSKTCWSAGMICSPAVPTPNAPAAAADHARRSPRHARHRDRAVAANSANAAAIRADPN